MIKKEIRQNILAQCKNQAKKLNLQGDNPNLHILQRFFDTIDISRDSDEHDQNNDLESIIIHNSDYNLLIPQHIHHHIANLRFAIEQHTVELWSLNLAALVRDLLFEPKAKTLRQDILNAIGKENVKKIRHNLQSLRMPQDELERSITKAYVSLLFQYMIAVHFTSHDVIKVIEFAVHSFNICDKRMLEERRINCLKNNLCLDKNNVEHLIFWAKYTKRLFNHFGGSALIFSNLRYYVPDRIWHMMTLDTSRMSYQRYVHKLDVMRIYASHELFKCCLRDDFVEYFYNYGFLDYFSAEHKEKLFYHPIMNAPTDEATIGENQNLQKSINIS